MNGVLFHIFIKHALAYAVIALVGTAILFNPMICHCDSGFKAKIGKKNLKEPERYSLLTLILPIAHTLNTK